MHLKGLQISRSLVLHRRCNKAPFATYRSQTQEISTFQVLWHTILPHVFASLARTATSESALSESSPVVGSSKKMACASLTRLMPTETRRRSPPEIPAIAPSMSWPMRASPTASKSWRRGNPSGRGVQHTPLHSCRAGHFLQWRKIESESILLAKCSARVSPYAHFARHGAGRQCMLKCGA